MSVKLKRGELSPYLVEALEKVAQIDLPAPLAYNVSRLRRKIRTALQETQNTYTNKLKTHIILKEDGTAVFEKDEAGNEIPGKWIYNSPTALSEFQEFEKSYVEEEVEIKSFPITLSSLEHAQISAATLDCLEPILFAEGDALLDQ